MAFMPDPSQHLVDDLGDFLGLVAVAAGQRAQFAGLGRYRALAWACAGHLYPAAAAELHQPSTRSGRSARNMVLALTPSTAARSLAGGSHYPDRPRRRRWPA